MFACDNAEIGPDIMCLSKGLTGGYMPMAIAVTTQEIYDAFYDDYLKGKAFMHSHTYAGNPLACSAAVEVLKILKDEKIIEKANVRAKYFNKIIKEKFSSLENVGEVRSIGLINAIELVKALFCEVNPIPVKEAMNIIGFNCGTPRLPLIELSNSGKEQLKKAIENFNK